MNGLVGPLPPLLLAIRDSSIDVVRALLPTAQKRFQLGVGRPSFVSPLGMSLMVLLLSQDTKDTAFEVFKHVLLNSDANIVVVLMHRVDVSGVSLANLTGSPLMFCALYNASLEWCRLLLERGANPNVLANVSSNVTLLVDGSGKLLRTSFRDAPSSRIEKVSPLFEIICRKRRRLLHLVLDSAECNFWVLASSVRGVAVGLLAVVRWFGRFDLLADILMHKSQPKLQLNDDDRERVFRFMSWSNLATRTYLPAWFKKKIECLSLCMNRVCVENAISSVLFKDVKRNVLFRLVQEADMCH
jgi:hypothetical protein